VYGRPVVSENHLAKRSAISVSEAALAMLQKLNCSAASAKWNLRELAAGQSDGLLLAYGSRLSRVLVRFNHVASIIVNANHSIMQRVVRLCVADWRCKGTANVAMRRIFYR
jgi:hypothetical protein